MPRKGQILPPPPFGGNVKKNKVTCFNYPKLNVCFAPFDIDQKDPKVYFAVLAEKLRLFAMKTEVGIYKRKQESKKKRTRPRK